MKSVIIISYYFEPSGFVGGERTFAWAKFMNEFGLYPVIVTRNWNKNQKDLTSRIENNTYAVTKHENYEVHRLPIKDSLRNKLARKGRFHFLQKALTFSHLLFSNLWQGRIDHYSFKQKCRQIIQDRNDVIAIVASAQPFNSFAIGYSLKKEFPKIKWVPDYRDEWNSHRERVHIGLLWRLIGRLERRNELKWTRNADFFSTVSESVCHNLEKHINKNGIVVMNGIDEFQHLESKSNPTPIRILYAGTLYPYQPIQTVVSSFNELAEKGINLQVQFVGTELMPETHKKLSELCAGNEIFKISARVPREKLNELYRESDLLLLTSYNENKGWYPVKMFNYASCNRPVLLFPSDKDSMETFITKARIGFVCNSNEELEEIVRSIQIGTKLSELGFEPDKVYLNSYTRKEQTRNFVNKLLRT